MRIIGTEKDVAIIRDTVRKVQRGTVVNQQRRRSVGVVPGGPKTAKTQEAWQTDGTVSCKLLDDNGDVTGDDFDVYVLVAKTATDVTSGYWPTIANDQEIMIMKDREGDWILVRPDVEESESCT
jgi:hypothetical protein